MPRKLSKAEEMILDTYRRNGSAGGVVVLSDSQLAGMTGYSRSYVKEARHYLIMRGLLRISGHRYSKPMRIEVVQ